MFIFHGNFSKDIHQRSRLLCFTQNDHTGHAGFKICPFLKWAQIVIGESPDSLSNALEDGPVLGIMNPGDVDGNGISDDGHAVIITDFDAENGTVYYWDPETGDMDNGSVGDFLGGWGINGTKE